jgi:hypothetical protein
MSTTNAIHEGFRNLAPLTAEDPANLSRDLTMLVQSNLSVNSILVLGKTSRRWANLTNDPQLWRYLLLRDFGKEFAKNVLDQDCKYNYIQMYKAVQEFLREIQGNDDKPWEGPIPGGQALLDTSRLDQSVKLCGLISCRGFKVFLDKLSIEQLVFIFKLAASHSLIPLMKLIIQHPLFKEIPTNSYHGLGYALSNASMKGQITAMNLIMLSSGFKEIPANGNYGLGIAFVNASSSGQIAAMNLIMQSSRFKEIPADGVYGLGNAFSHAALQGQIDAMNLIMQSSRFKEIPANGSYGLGNAFVFASSKGKTSAVDLIKADPRFSEIDMSSVYLMTELLEDYMNS